MKPSDIHYIRHCFRRQANAGAKPSTDIEDVLAAIGAKPIGLPRAYFTTDKAVHLRDILNTLIVRAAMPRGKTVLIQYPAQHDISTLARLAKRRRNRLIVVVHDINALRGRPEADHPDVLAAADVIFAHTPAMQKWLRQRYPKAQIIVPGMFDYIQQSIPAGTPPGTPSVVFAGNLAKSTFLRKLDFPQSLRLVLFGVGAPDELIQKPFVEYRGSCMPEEIPARISNETFGLVWDGDSPQGCTGPMGEYLRYNAPYKLSSYIAAGIPVIIWSQMGIARFVKDHNIGITVDNLNDLPEILAKITPERYDAMRTAARTLQAQVSTGHFARTAIGRSITPQIADNQPPK